MCNIGKPVGIIVVEPLSLPAPLRKESEPEQPTIIEVPVEVEAPVLETAVAKNR